jgi:hypothetical protein
MDNWNKNLEPKKVPNLGSRPPYKEPIKKQGISQNVQFQKYNSEKFNETKIKYQDNMAPIPNLNKNGQNRAMPKEQYTEEERLQRPIEDRNKRLNIVGKQKEELSFSKSLVNPIAQKISIENEIPLDKKKNQKKKKKENEATSMEIPPLAKKTKIPWMLLLAIFVEGIILLFVLYYRNEKMKTSLECTNETYNEYYHAKILNTKKYDFKKGIITKLEDTFVYTFDTEEAYNTFKEVNANPEKENISGRLFQSSIDEDQKKYTETTTYLFNKLRKKNETEEEHTILVNSKNENDVIQLLDYNSTDIKLIYESEYICK